MILYDDYICISNLFILLHFSIMLYHYLSDLGNARVIIEADNYPFINMISFIIDKNNK